jgi:hypothetical protein
VRTRTFRCDFGQSVILRGLPNRQKIRRLLAQLLGQPRLHKRLIGNTLPFGCCFYAETFDEVLRIVG